MYIYIYIHTCLPRLRQPKARAREPEGSACSGCRLPRIRKPKQGNKGTYALDIITITTITITITTTITIYYAILWPHEQRKAVLRKSRQPNESDELSSAFGRSRPTPFLEIGVRPRYPLHPPLQLRAHRIPGSSSRRERC